MLARLSGVQRFVRYPVVATVLSVMACARPVIRAANVHGDAPATSTLPGPPVLRPDAFDAPLPCEIGQLHAVAVPWSCMATGDVDLGVLLGAGGCRVPLPAVSEQRDSWCTRGLAARVTPEPAAVHPGQRVTLHVAVTNVLDQTRLVDVDPHRLPQALAWPIDGRHPSNAGEDPVRSICTMGAEPDEPPGPERVRMALGPGATLHFDIPWRAAWTDTGPRCNPVDRVLPRGLYRVWLIGPVLAREPFEVQLEVR